MKLYISFKTPNAVEYAIKEQITNFMTYDRDNCCDNQCGSNCVKVLADEEEEDAKSELNDTLKKFVAYGECITIEFDTNNRTATVVEL